MDLVAAPPIHRHVAKSVSGVWSPAKCIEEKAVARGDAELFRRVPLSKRCGTETILHFNRSQPSVDGGLGVNI